MPIIRALWITAHNLGVVEDRTDTALAAFVKRQTGLESPNWMTDFADAVRVIEGLKAMLARAGLDWPRSASAVVIKRRVVRLQWSKLVERGLKILYSADVDLDAYAAAVARNNPRVGTVDMLTEEELDRVAQALGRKLRTQRTGG